MKGGVGENMKGMRRRKNRKGWRGYGLEREVRERKVNGGKREDDIPGIKGQRGFLPRQLYTFPPLVPPMLPHIFPISRPAPSPQSFSVSTRILLFSLVL